MNKKGFTLVEVLAVMIILGLLMLLVVPSINKLMKDNDEKKYSTYERMMEEYENSQDSYTQVEEPIIYYKLVSHPVQQESANSKE